MNNTHQIAEETPPKAGVMINTFRAFGYNLQTSIADIIDNSISAPLRTLRFTPYEEAFFPPSTIIDW